MKGRITVQDRGVRQRHAERAGFQPAMRRTFGLMTGIDSHLARARARGVDTYLMETERDKPGPRVFDVLGGEALETRSVPFGDVGTLFSGDGIECVWVRKLDEEIDPDCSRLTWRTSSSSFRDA